jgi:tricorn protease
MLSATLIALASMAPTLQPEGPLWFQHPTANATTICFSFGGDLWTVSREGGDAQRLTSSAGQELNPHYSPDGKWIAFSGQYEGNVDAYVVAAEGGIPKRLTFHPTEEMVQGWTPDSARVLYAADEAPFVPRLFTVSKDGGPSRDLPFPTGTMGSFSPDGKQIAYVPYMQFQGAWKRYRGGETFPIWVAKLEDSTWKELPRKNTNEKSPMWIGDKIYFLSDRKGRFDLYSCNPNGSGQKELAKSGDFDFLTATAGPGVIALSRPGSIMLYDIASGKLANVPVTVRGDFPEVRRKFVPLANHIASGEVSPNGKRAVFEARGEVITVPISKGDARNMTESSGSAERAPSWSPDAKWIAYLSDASGEYKIVLHPSDGQGESKILEPGQAPAYYNSPVWSPDSKKLAYSDNRGMLWITEIESGKSTKVDEAPLLPVAYQIQPSWSPDSKWVTFARQTVSYLKAIFLYSLETSKLTQLTDGLSDAQSPAFDRGGKYLYFLASTNTKTTPGWLDLSVLETPNVTSSVYVVVLPKDLPSPFSPESDEEPVGEVKKAEEKKEFRIDLDGIASRVLAIPMPARVYGALVAGAPGSFFAADIAPLATISSPGGPANVRKFDLNARQEMPFLQGVQGFTISANGQHMLALTTAGVRIVGTGGPPPPGSGTLNLGGVTIRVEPKQEWKQMFLEALRIQRDYFYDPGYHGVDLVKLRQKYEPFVDGLMSRQTLNELFTDMLGELSVGHMYIGGGDIPGVSGTSIGLLGADYSLENGRWRFKRVYNGENWNPGLVAPLSAPGVDVKAGEYLLAVDGKEIKAEANVYVPFEGRVGKQVRIKVGPDPGGAGSREVIVVPIGNENGLRVYGWVEDNRRKVEELSGGRVGYVWIPNTSVQGYDFFNRYFYAQSNRDGVVLDERFNGGGSVADYFITMLQRPVMSWWMTRYGQDFTSPLVSIFGPKAMIINQYAGSGGDYLPWAFKRAKIGPVVGKRTWGGLVGILGFPSLIDGGGVTSPNLAFYTPDGQWEVENYGTPPDIDVELDPVLWRQGRDAQLERAVEEVMKQLKNYKKPTPNRPKFKDNTKVGGGS